MRVWYRNFEFVSIDEIQEAYNISLYDGWFYDISVLNKFILVKKKFFNDVLEITKKIRTDLSLPVINNIHILTCDMLDVKLSESEMLDFIESDFSKFISIENLNKFRHREICENK